IETVAGAGCSTFIVHARKAWLGGLSPKQNRDVPPLDYDRVYRLKAARPGLTIIINGGITTLDEADAHLDHVDGVMLGRAAYQSPWVLADVDRRYYDEAAPTADPGDVVLALTPYISEQLGKGHRLHSITRHMVGLYQGVPGARMWRRTLSDAGARPDAGLELLREALDCVTRRSQAA
nr:tRNA-dihydrouridine synthase [Hyphomicrobiales bacterium]